MVNKKTTEQQLRACSKDDLIWIIKRVLLMTTLTDWDYYVSRALGDLRYEKDRRKLNKADEYADLSYKKRLEYIELLSPYDGVPFKDIPLDVLQKADKAMNEAQAADKKWNKLMGI